MGGRMNIEPKALLSDGEGIPTTTDNYFNYDYGIQLNAKLRELGWSAKQFDSYLDYMHQEKDIDSLVADYLFYAPLNAIRQEAEALGIFEEEE
jgi:hypothetical protein